MKKFIFPVILLALGAGLATAASFAAKTDDCCQSEKKCCEAMDACCETADPATVRKDCCQPVQECCETVADCCGPVTGIESAEK